MLNPQLPIEKKTTDFTTTFKDAANDGCWKFNKKWEHLTEKNLEALARDILPVIFVSLLLPRLRFEAANSFKPISPGRQLSTCSKG